MNLRLRRLVRTPTSEQYALHNLDQKGEDDSPVCVGKLDVHYTDEGTYGTLLLWQGETSEIPQDELDCAAGDLIAGLAEPMGVSGEYVIEQFSPSVESYKVFSNIEE